MKYIYNPETLKYDVVDEPAWARFLRIFVMICGAAGLVVLFIWLYTVVLGQDLPKTAILKKKNATWKAKLEVVDRQLGIYDQVLGGIELRDDKVYRSIYGLNEVPDQLKYSGNVGENRYAEMEEGGASADLLELKRRVDMLAKRTIVQDKALEEVDVLSRKAGVMISCVPSVPPLRTEAGTFHASSSFGLRRDPVFGGREYHKGQDFSAKKGTPIYCTGDGVVVNVNYSFRGYGNEVVVDHGYGYQTRYAHMSKIDVRKGQKLQRGEKVGEVGSSGKSTGAHLHYEVLYKGHQVNPMNYMDLSMSVEEYDAMINTRMEESTENKRTSVTELLRRRRNVNGR